MVDRLHLPGAIIQSGAQPDNCDRPRDIAFTDARARATAAGVPPPLPERITAGSPLIRHRVS